MHLRLEDLLVCNSRSIRLEVERLDGGSLLKECVCLRILRDEGASLAIFRCDVASDGTRLIQLESVLIHL